MKATTDTESSGRSVGSTGGESKSSSSNNKDTHFLHCTQSNRYLNNTDNGNEGTRTTCRLVHFSSEYLQDNLRRKGESINNNVSLSSSSVCPEGSSTQNSDGSSSIKCINIHHAHNNFKDNKINTSTGNPISTKVKRKPRVLFSQVLLPR